ncbi:MAG: ATP-binding protein [Tomitella sp.]|nr:ATP-binding protein [Tomitella sp.]
MSLLAGFKIMTVPCRSCGADVRRASGMPGQPDGWRDNVLCTECRGESPEEDWTALLEDKARQRLHERILRFDAAAGYENAAIDAPDVASTRWAEATQDAIMVCRRQDTARDGVMFVGPTGIGKTYAAFAVCNAAARALGPDGVRFTTEEDLLGGDVASWQLKAHIARFLLGAHTVLIDDIGVASRRSDQIQAAWKELCGQIAAQPGPMMIVGTTNRQGWDGDQGISAWMGAQAASRMRQWTSEATTGWTDKRTGVLHERWRSLITGGQ